MTTKKQKIMSIVNICNVLKPTNKENVKFWVLKIKELCGEVLICR